jgi:hypothetical protein
MKKQSQKPWQIACFLYFLLLLLIVITADMGNLPYDLLGKIPHYDVYGHFILYGIASFLSHLALGGRKIVIDQIFLPLGPFLFAIVTIAEEIMQTLFPTRTFSLLDLSSSLIGIILFYYLAELWISYHKKCFGR